jgi:hypothetical protein
MFQLVTRGVPTAILWVTGPASDAPNPDLRSGLEGKTSDELRELQSQFDDASQAADGRAAASVPAAGLLGAIAGVFSGTLEARTVLIVGSAATILAALFAANAQVNSNPGEVIDSEVVTRAAYALRRKVAWARLSSYLAFLLATAVAILVAAS